MGLDADGNEVKPESAERSLGELQEGSEAKPGSDADHAATTAATATAATGSRAKQYDDIGRRIKRHVTETDLFSRYSITFYHQLQ